MKKLSSIATTLDVYFRIGFWFTIIGTFLSVPIIVVFFGLSRDNPQLYQSFAQSLSFGPITFGIADGYAADPVAGYSFLVLNVVICLVYLPIYCMMIKCIRNVLAPLKAGDPFRDAMAKNLKRLGWLVMVNGALNLVYEFISVRSTLSLYDLKELFLSEKILSVNAYYRFDLTFVLYALVLIGLSMVFRYGQELQQLSDETL